MINNRYIAAIIGTGRIGFSLGFDKKREQPASHTMALFGNKKINLIAAADKNSENLARWQRYAKKRKSLALTFSSSDELYKNISCLDIITVAVNEECHLEECLKAISQKPKLVILEKPVALNSEEAEKILEASKNAKVPVIVNHERRFSKDYLLAKTLIPKIGEIQNVVAELDSGLRIYAPEFEKNGTYSLIHDGTHLVDIVNFLLGDYFEKDCHSELVPASSKGILNQVQNDAAKSFLSNPILTEIYKDDKNIVRNFTANYHTEKIPEIQIKMSGRSKFFEFRIEILGTLGKIVVGNGIHEFYLREESKLYSGFYSLTKQKVKFPKKTEYFSGMVQNAIDFLDGKPANLVSPLEDAIEDLRILEEIKAKL